MRGFVTKQRYKRPKVAWGEQASEQSPLLLVFFALGENETKADRVCNQTLEEGRLLKRVAFVMQDFFVGGQSSHQNRVRIAHVQVTDQPVRRPWPLPHPGQVRFVGVATSNLVKDMTDEEMVVLCERISSWLRTEVAIVRN